jgi:hypothetical protein
MYYRRSALLLAGSVFLLYPSAALAGMPSPLPTDLERVLRLNDTALMRLQTISFFLVGLLLSAGAVQLLWNYLQRDFPKLPRLSYGKALAGVLLWGLLFIIVLTMISGARELMTPGAWNKEGFTYKLAGNAKQQAEEDPGILRKQHLEHLRTALWQFAAKHQGRFPSSSEVAAMPPDLWDVPESGGMRYLYVPGRSAGPPRSLLAYEPELDPDQRWVLLTDGTITRKRSGQIQLLLPKKVKP